LYCLCVDDLATADQKGGLNKRASTRQSYVLRHFVAKHMVGKVIPRLYPNPSLCLGCISVRMKHVVYFCVKNTAVVNINLDYFSSPSNLTALLDLVEAADY
jgi:hypothetical protein